MPGSHKNAHAAWHKHTKLRCAAALLSALLCVPRSIDGSRHPERLRNNLTNHSTHVSRFIDGSAGTVVRVLKQYPVARLAAAAYLLFIHASIYYLVGRLQRRAIGELAFVTRGNASLPH